MTGDEDDTIERRVDHLEVGLAVIRTDLVWLKRAMMLVVALAFPQLALQLL